MGGKTFWPITVILMSQSKNDNLRARLRVALISAKNRTGEIRVARDWEDTRREGSAEDVFLACLSQNYRTTRSLFLCRRKLHNI